ncbi:Diaminohydroxyphosphoribosylamino-pyrimidine deaminase [Trichoderma ghanense]|uniref:Diaminohydroxyphosphoribosylamino-pyrimidine deaminase n=1 Tax=Trichoderma ghanense TaxID=65468 RepID=A0ABY2H614_9HYPO
MANPLNDLLSSLEDEIQDPEEETFLLYANTSPLQGLGFIDARSSTLDVQLNGKDVTIHQSPGVLASSRKGGTTGAVLWKITPLFAEWLSHPTNPLTPLLAKSSIIELGCGISPLNALSLAHTASRYILTDQPYVQKLVLQNLSSNLPFKPSSSSTTKSHPSSRSKKPTTTHKSPSPSSSTSTTPAEIHFEVLDWETSQITPSLTHSPTTTSFDAIVSCDCVYNYALIQPFVQTCVDICALRKQDIINININNNKNSSSSSSSRVRNQDSAGVENAPPCLCIVAQQLRNDDVFNSWLTAFQKHFRVWRVPGERMPVELRPEAGFVVHVGILKDSL